MMSGQVQGHEWSPVSGAGPYSPRRVEGSRGRVHTAGQTGSPTTGGYWWLLVCLVARLLRLPCVPCQSKTGAERTSLVVLRAAGSGELR